MQSSFFQSNHNKPSLTIKIGVTFRDGEIGKNNIRYLTELNKAKGLQNSKIEVQEIDWRCLITQNEIANFLESYKKELDASTFTDRGPYTEEEKQNLLAQARKSYEIQSKQTTDQSIDEYLSHINALYVPGFGHNPDKKFCADDTNRRVAAMGGAFLIDPDKRRQEFEIKLVRKAIEKGIPVLGICAGSWLVLACFQGTKTKVLSVEDPTYALHDCGGQAKVDGEKINRARLHAHSANITSNTMLAGIVGNAARWTPQKGNQKLQKTLQPTEASQKKLVMVHKDDEDVNKFSEGYHLIYSKDGWELIYRKRDTLNLLENNNDIKIVTVPIGLDLIEGLKELLTDKTFDEISQNKQIIEEIITRNLLMWVNSTHWRVMIAQDETGKLDDNNQLIISAIEPTYRTIEAFEARFGVPVIGIQWHPELTIPEWITKKGSIPNPEYPADRRILEAFAESALTHAKKMLVVTELEAKNKPKI